MHTFLKRKEKSLVDKTSHTYFPKEKRKEKSLVEKMTYAYISNDMSQPSI